MNLRKPRIIELPRMEDRITYLYINKTRVEQNKTGVIATWNPESEYAGESTIPSASLNVLLLGPGTSITTPAVTTLHRSGCNIVFCGEGMTGYATATPLTVEILSFLDAQQVRKIFSYPKPNKLDNCDTTTPRLPIQTKRRNKRKPKTNPYLRHNTPI